MTLSLWLLLALTLWLGSGFAICAILTWIAVFSKIKPYCAPGPAPPQTAPPP